jgi:hypothetical protein
LWNLISIFVYEGNGKVGKPEKYNSFTALLGGYKKENATKLDLMSYLSSFIPSSSAQIPMSICTSQWVAVIRPKTEDCPRTKNEDCNKTKNSTGIGPKKMRGAVIRPKNITGTGIGPKNITGTGIGPKKTVT